MKKLFLTAFLTLFVLNFIMPPQSDDIAVFLGIQSQNHSFFGSYFTNNGRIGEILYTGFFAKFNQSIFFDLLNAFVGSLFLFAVFVLFFGKLPRDRDDLLKFSLLATLMTLFNTPGSTFLWGSGSFNYLWGASFVVAFLLPFRLFWLSLTPATPATPTKFSLVEVAKALGLFVLGVVAGMGNELANLVICGLLFVNILFVLRARIYARLWHFGGAFGFWAGYLLLLLSPGSHQRGAGQRDFTGVSELLNLDILALLKRFYLAFNGLYSFGFVAFFLVVLVSFLNFRGVKFRWQHVVGVAVCGVAVAVLTKHVAGLPVAVAVLYMLVKMSQKEKKLWVLVWLFAGVMCANIPLIAIGSRVAHRAHFGTNLVLFFEIIVLMWHFCGRERLEKWVKVALSVGLAAFLLNCIQVRVSWEVLKSEATKTQEVVVSKWFFKRLYPFCDWNDLKKGEANWVGDAYAKFLGVKSVWLK